MSSAFVYVFPPALPMPISDTGHLTLQGVRTKQAIAELMQSPQFHQQLDAFTQVCSYVYCSSGPKTNVRAS